MQNSFQTIFSLAHINTTEPPSPAPESSEEQKPDLTYIIIGAVVVVVISAVILLIICITRCRCCSRKWKSKLSEESDSTLYSDDPKVRGGANLSVGGALDKREGVVNSNNEAYTTVASDDTVYLTKDGRVLDNSESGNSSSRDKKFNGSEAEQSSGKFRDVNGVKGGHTFDGQVTRMDKPIKSSQKASKTLSGLLHAVLVPAPKVEPLYKVNSGPINAKVVFKSSAFLSQPSLNGDIALPVT